jgi:5-methylcytosine-specific restriction endonuclease McrA
VTPSRIVWTGDGDRRWKAPVPSNGLSISSRTRRSNPKRRKRLRQLVLERDRYVCTYCGGVATTVDHVVSLNRGGADDPSNLVASCELCNTALGWLGL